MPAAADEVIDFISSLRHTKGEHAGKPFRLRPWQKQIVRNVFARDRRGHRKHREVLLGVARKNGKTELTAAMAIALLVLDREPGGEVIGAAAKRDQARLMLDAAKRMVAYSSIAACPCPST